MRIAIASQNFRTITGHAGKTRRFLLFEALPDTPAQEIGRIDLPKEMALHGFSDAEPHPLDTVDALIVGSAGEGFVRRMARRGVRVLLTSETDPLRAATALVAGTLTPPMPELHAAPVQGHGAEGSCGCGGHGHGHGHGHHHDHDHGEGGCGCGH